LAEKERKENEKMNRCGSETEREKDKGGEKTT
jgi:hypothetical protein